MDKKKWFTVSSWGSVIFGIIVIFDSFNYWVAPFEFYFYLILIAGILGIGGALISLGIFPTIGGFMVCGALIYFSAVFGVTIIVLFSFIKAVGLLIGGCGMILTFELPEGQQKYELARLGMNKGEYFALRDVGISTLEELCEEKGNEKEICSITSISLVQLRAWIEKAEKVLEEHDNKKKDQLRQDYKDKFKK